MRGRDAQHQTLLLRVPVLGPQLGVGDEHTGAGPDPQPGVVHQARDGVVHRRDLELQRGGDAGLVLVRPVQPHGPGHQHQPVLQAVAPVVKVLEIGRLGGGTLLWRAGASGQTLPRFYGLNFDFKATKYFLFVCWRRHRKNSFLLVISGIDVK